MHPRDMMLLNEDEAGTMSSVDFEFAREWYGRGVMAERKACKCRQVECESSTGCRMAAEVSAKVLGVGRDADNAKVLVVYFEREPSDDDLRRTHDLLRSNAELTGVPPTDHTKEQ